MSELADLERDLLGRIADAADLAALEDVRVRYTGRRSELAVVQRQLAELDADQRRSVGAAVNALRREVEQLLDDRRQELATAERSARLEAERIDVTLPPRRVPPGRPHLVTQVIDEIVGVFAGLGYVVADGPEIEDAVFNFDLLNIEPDHPARQSMDTIYVDGDDRWVLRTHTSPVQARTMLAQRPPIAIVVPGRVYRNEAADATHSAAFVQVEGLAVAAGLTMADLHGTLVIAARALFGDEPRFRMRPDMFPFTEPSAQLDVSCPFCSGAGSDCRVCKGSGWLEILGAGMVDPNVLRDCGHDPDVVSGFAFGMGVERVAMLRHGIRDLRDLYDADVRSLERF